jgi:hypothetical protein
MLARLAQRGALIFRRLFKYVHIVDASEAQDAVDRYHAAFRPLLLSKSGRRAAAKPREGQARGSALPAA